MEKLSPLVQSAMPILISLMRDPHVMVKDSSTWTIGKICELHGPSIPGEVLTPLVEALLLALKDTPRVCSKACFALHNFGDQFEETRDAESNALSPYLTALVQELLLATQREDGGLGLVGLDRVEGFGGVVFYFLSVRERELVRFWLESCRLVMYVTNILSAGLAFRHMVLLCA